MEKKQKTALEYTESRFLCKSKIFEFLIFSLTKWHKPSGG